MTKNHGRLARFPNRTSRPPARRTKRRDEDYNINTKQKYKKVSKKSKKYSALKQLDYALYYPIGSKLKEFRNTIEILQYAKVLDGVLTQDLKDYCLIVLGEFLEQYNNDFSKLLGTHIKLIIPSNRWSNTLYSNKSNFPLPTIFGYEL